MTLKKHFIAWYAASAAFLLVFLTPVLWRSFFLHPPHPGYIVHSVVQVILIGLCPLGAWLAFAGEGLTLRRRAAAWWVVLCAAAICEVVHYWVTDRGHYFPTSMFADNTAWQLWMHGPILDLAPGALPHSYRFLPDAIVSFFNYFAGDYVISRIAYRLLFNALLFAALYRLARSYVTDVLAAATVAVIAAIYPISILKYAGQYVDPLSHLAIIATLLCLVRGYEPGFGALLFVGLFAKESVIVMAACRFFYGPNRWRAALLTALYFAVALAIVLAIRAAVLRGHLEYGEISGVGLKHIPENLAGYQEWILMYVAIGMTVVPGAILGWKYMDRPFLWSTVIVVAAMLVSSLMFSWMSEVRNSVPAFMLLAVISARWAQQTLDVPATIRTRPAEPADTLR